MQQGQDFRRFGYKPLQGTQYAQPRVAESDYFDPQDDNNNIIKRISGGIMAGLRNSPFLSTFSVVAAGAVFAFAVYSFYPSSEDEMVAVPIIKAEAVPIKMEPVDVGGMEIPFQDSTIFDADRMASSGGGRIENLLDPSASLDEPVMDKDALLAEQNGGARGSEMANITESPAFAASGVTEAGVSDEKPVQNILAEDPAPESAPVEDIAETGAEAEAETSATVAQANPTMNEAGQSPETLAFVRSVLEKKDAQKSAAVDSAPEKVEPAAGVEGNYSGTQTHYVQLASISDRTRADAEWEKLKKDMAAIPGNSGYRVEEANLEKGTFFRIQAGPYSEAQAKDICEAIKAQKPGGCLVVR